MAKALLNEALLFPTAKTKPTIPTKTGETMLKHNKITAGVLSTIASAGIVAAPLMAQAGTIVESKETKEVVEVEEKPEKVVSGTLSLDVNTHFISYGYDVWGGGGQWKDALFNPSLELSLALGGGFSWILGTWWDVNDQADSDIGGSIQEIDVWTGFGYEKGIFQTSLLGQAWNYGGGTEWIVDWSMGLDVFLKPSILFHGRVSNDLGLEDGLIVVFGIEEGFDLGPVTFSFPVNLAFGTDQFHTGPGSNGGGGGYAYTSVGANLSVPLPFLPGEWEAHAGVTYYNTNPNYIPNPSDNFVTGNAGVSLSF
jgi:hypothetical protein